MPADLERDLGLYATITISIGAWFSLVFKSAFALVGLGAYLLLFAPALSGDPVVGVSLGIAVLLLVVNVVGVKQSGGLQAAIVSLVLLALVAFVADGLTYVDQAKYHPFFRFGSLGVLEATGFVFVYTFVVFVIVGVVPHDTLKGTLTPMAVAAERLLGGYGGTVFAVVAVLALTSMANAGVLSASRFPLAMSRDHLAPVELSANSERFRTRFCSRLLPVGGSHRKC